MAFNIINSFIGNFFPSINGEAWDKFKNFWINLWEQLVAWFEANTTAVIITILIICVLLLLTVFLERISTFLIKKLGRKNEWADEIINGIAFFWKVNYINSWFCGNNINWWFT